MHALIRVLKVMDTSGDDALSRDELKAGLLDLGIDVSLSDMENLMIYFDRDHSGTISFSEFCDGIRGELSEKRLGMINRAFVSVEDPIGSGQTTFETLEEEISSTSKHSDALLNEMDSQIEERQGDTIILLSEFIDYYRTLSAAVDGDRKFEALLQDTYPNVEMKPVVVVSRNSSTSRNSNNSRNGSRNGSRMTRQPTRQGGSRSGSRSNSNTKSQEEDALARFRKNKKRPDLAHNKGIVRLRAAAKLQSIFRGHKGRTKVNYERRKKEQASLREVQDNKEKAADAKRVRRTQPKHNPRFQAARR